MKLSKYCLICVFVALATFKLGAQETSPSPVPLPSPILAKLPPSVTWKIVTKKLPEIASSSKPLDSAQSAPAVIETRIFNKVGTFIQIIKIDANGSETEQWRVGNGQYTIIPNSEDLAYMDPKSDEFFTSEFQDLKWVNATNFIGVRPYGEKVCWTFKDRVLQTNTREFEQVKSDAQVDGRQLDEKAFYADESVFVDQETRLPVVVIKGDTISTYSFSRPSDKLSIPEVLLRRLHADLEQEKAMRAGPPRPF